MRTLKFVNHDAAIQFDLTVPKDAAIPGEKKPAVVVDPKDPKDARSTTKTLAFEYELSTGKLTLLDEKEAVDNLASAADWLKHHQRCNGKVGAVGFCIGGKLAMLLAFSTDKLSAVVPFYGSMINKTFPGMPPPPASVPTKLSAPFMRASLTA